MNGDTNNDSTRFTSGTCDRDLNDVIIINAVKKAVEDGSDVTQTLNLDNYLGGYDYKVGMCCINKTDNNIWIFLEDTAHEEVLKDNNIQISDKDDDIDEYNEECNISIKAICVNTACIKDISVFDIVPVPPKKLSLNLDGTERTKFIEDFIADFSDKLKNEEMNKNNDSHNISPNINKRKRSR